MPHGDMETGELIENAHVHDDLWEFLGTNPCAGSATLPKCCQEILTHPGVWGVLTQSYI